MLAETDEADGGEWGARRGGAVVERARRDDQVGRAGVDERTVRGAEAFVDEIRDDDGSLAILRIERRFVQVEVGQQEVVAGGGRWDGR